MKSNEQGRRMDSSVCNPIVWSASAERAVACSEPGQLNAYLKTIERDVLCKED